MCHFYKCGVETASQQNYVFFVTETIILYAHKFIRTELMNFLKLHEYLNRKCEFNNCFSLRSVRESDTSDIRRYLFSSIFNRAITAKSIYNKNELLLKKGLHINIT